MGALVMGALVTGDLVMGALPGGIPGPIGRFTIGAFGVDTVVAAVLHGLFRAGSFVEPLLSGVSGRFRFVVVCGAVFTTTCGPVFTTTCGAIFTTTFAGVVLEATFAVGVVFAGEAVDGANLATTG